MKVILVLFLFPLSLAAQKMKVREYDKFIKKWRVETFPVNLKSAEEIKMDISLQATDTSYVIQLTGTGVGTNTLDANSELVLFFENDSAARGRSISIQSIDYGDLLPSYKHKYRVGFKALESLSKYPLKSLRKYSVGGFDDIAVDKKNTAKLKDASTSFIQELQKLNLVPVRTKAPSAAVAVVAHTATTTAVPPPSTTKAVPPPTTTAAPATQPGFPGGKEAMLDFLNRNFKTGQQLNANEERSVVVQFLVKSDGSVNDLKITQSANALFDTELLRVLHRMPEWKPALKNQQEVDAVVTQKFTVYRAGALNKIKF